MYLVIPLPEPEPIGSNLIPDELDFIKTFTGIKIPSAWWTELDLDFTVFEDLAQERRI